MVFVFVETVVREGYAPHHLDHQMFLGLGQLFVQYPSEILQRDGVIRFLFRLLHQKQGLVLSQIEVCPQLPNGRLDLLYIYLVIGSYDLDQQGSGRQA